MNRNFNMNLTEREKGYVSGMIDGEGCLHLSRTKDERNRNGVEYRCFLTITNSWRAALDYIKKCIGGGFIGAPPSQRAQYKGQRKRTIYVYSLYANGIRVLFPQILDYLIVKRKQAELLLKAALLKEENLHLHEKNSPVAPVSQSKLDANFDELERLSFQIRELNQKIPRLRNELGLSHPEVHEE